jgi:uncharacterized protein YkwD
MGVRNRLAAAMVAALMVLSMSSTNASASEACPGDEVPPTEATAYDSVMALVCDINEFRARNGLRPLSWDWRLWYGAQDHAADMAARHYLAHVSPEGHGLADRISPTGYIPPAAGWTLSENLGFGTMMLSSPLAIAVGWLNSEVHRENMLDRRGQRRNRPGLRAGRRRRAVGNHLRRGLRPSRRAGCRAPATRSRDRHPGTHDAAAHHGS